jgi:hypothetical protein
MTHANRIIIGNPGHDRNHYLNKELQALYNRGIKICSIVKTEGGNTYNHIVSQRKTIDMTASESEIASEIDAGFDLFLSMALAEPIAHPNTHPMVLVIEDNQLVRQIRHDHRLSLRFQQLMELATSKKISIWLVVQSYQPIRDNLNKKFVKTLDRSMLLDITDYNKSSEINWTALCQFLRIKESQYSKTYESAGQSLDSSTDDLCLYESKSKKWQSIPLLKHLSN